MTGLTECDGWFYVYDKGTSDYVSTDKMKEELWNDSTEANFLARLPILIPGCFL